MVRGSVACTSTCLYSNNNAKFATLERFIDTDCGVNLTSCRVDFFGTCLSLDPFCCCPNS